MRCARSWITLFAVLLLAALPFSASAQSYPSRPVTMYIGYAAGGSIDLLGRLLAEKLGEAWGQNVVVENRPGADSAIGVQAAARSSPDGYSLLFASQSLAVNVTTAPDTNFDPRRDLDPIMLIASAQSVLVVPPSSPFHNVRELIAYAKAHPGQLTTTFLGAGGSATLAALMFMPATGTNFQRIPYTSSTQANADLAAGRLSMAIPNLSGELGLIQAGQLRALAVSGRSRIAELPGVPTFTESGIKFDEEPSWYALFAPRGTPKDIIRKINNDLTRILAQPDIKQRSVTLGLRFIGGTPAQLQTFLNNEITKWNKVGADALMKAQ